METVEEVVPEGYLLHEHHGPLTEPWAPLYAKVVESSLWLGVRIRKAHCNSRMFAHGGLITALADNAMGLSIRIALRGKLGTQPGGGVTVNLAVDFLGSAQIGQWLEIQPRVLRVGTSLACVDAVLLADGNVIGRANATFRIRTAKSVATE